MSRFPKSMEMISEVMMAIAARNEMYWNTPAPGISN
jgi:hypothetical protein